MLLNMALEVNTDIGAKSDVDTASSSSMSSFRGGGQSNKEMPESSSKPQTRNLKIYICTWNVNTQNPDFKLNDLIAFESDNQPDVCVFGFQEVNSRPLQRLLDYFLNDPWTNQLTDLLANGFDFVRIQSTRLVGLLLLTFVKRPLLRYVRFCGDEWIRLGFWGLWGNKGANICALSIGLLNLTLVNSHLSAHQKHDKIRLMEHSKILYHQFNFGNCYETLTDQEYMFLFGDLNFRTEKIKMEQVREMIKNNELEKLLEYDQLKRCIREENGFSCFKEHNIEFAPTYKFKRNTDIYDLSKDERIPSWCDRILFKSPPRQQQQKQQQTDEASTNKPCECVEYNSISSFNQSDHKPVYGMFQIQTHNWENDVPSILFSGITSSSDQNLEVTCHVNKSVMVTDPNDWIGIYQSDFKSSTDYVTYVWAPRIPELENSQIKRREKSVSIKNSKDEDFIQRKIVIQQSYLKNGFFILGYFSHVAKGLIGISNPFELKFN